jgi:hypothetical protein
MIKNSEDQKPSGNMELPGQAPACDSECGCHKAAPTSRIRWILGAIILVVVAGLVVRATMKNNGGAIDQSASGFGAVPIAEQTPGLITQVGNEISAFSDLNTVAADTNAVFVFLPGKNGTDTPPTTQMQGAEQTLKAKGIKVSSFTLKPGSRDYDAIVAQMPVPGIVVMVKGAGMNAVSGDITETKLIQAFVAASSAGGCGPASGGCGPSGCK